MKPITLQQFLETMDADYYVHIANRNAKRIGDNKDDKLVKRLKNARVIAHAPTDTNEYTVKLDIEGVSLHVMR